MKVLVVGGTGNISSGIVRALLAKGDDVSIFVRGQRPDPFGYPPDVRRVIGDRYDYESYERTVREGRYDAVIDMMGFTADDAASDLRAVEGTDTHLVYCSTVMVYPPRPSQVPTPEEEPFGPDGDYGRGKEASERLLLASGHPVTIFRPAFNYGRWDQILRQLGSDLAFPDKLRKGRPIVVLDTADRARLQTLHVDDAGVAFAYCVQRPACIGKVYNVAGDQALTWEEYHRQPAAAIGAPEADIVPISADVLERTDPARATMATGMFAADALYTTDALRRDVPEFRQTISWPQGFVMQMEFLEQRGLLTDADADPWEDALVSAARAR